MAADKVGTLSVTLTLKDSSANTLISPVISDSTSTVMAEGLGSRFTILHTGASSLALDDFGFTTVKQLVVKNLDSANFLIVTLDDTGANSIEHDIQAGEIAVFSGVDATTAVTLQSDTASVECVVACFGA